MSLKSTIGLIAAGILAGAAFLVLVVFLALSFLAFLAFAVLLAVAAGLVSRRIMSFMGRTTTCPQCGKGWAMTVSERRVVESKKGLGLVTRYTHSFTLGQVSESSRARGEDGSIPRSGVTSWQERVPVVWTTYELLSRCRFCGAEWKQNSIEKSADLGDEATKLLPP